MYEDFLKFISVNDVRSRNLEDIITEELKIINIEIKHLLGYLNSMKGLPNK